MRSILSILPKSIGIAVSLMFVLNMISRGFRSVDPLTISTAASKSWIDSVPSFATGEESKLTRKFSQANSKNDINGFNLVSGPFVFHMHLMSTDSREILRTGLEALGAAKAGHVELGSKVSGEDYYHFTIPLAQESALAELLNESGALKVEKLSHNRHVPDGFARIILKVNASSQVDR